MRIRGGRILVGIVLSFTLAVVSLVAFGVCFAVLLRPAYETITTAHRFHPTNCTVEETSTVVKDCSQECIHGNSCPETLTCNQIHVSYVTSGGNITLSTLYDDLSTLTHQPTCSVWVSCPNEEPYEDIQATIANFTAKWGQVGTSYTCLYDIYSPDLVVIHNVDMPDKHMIFHALFWPACVFAISMSIYVFFHYRRRKIHKRYQEYVERLGLNGNASNVVYRKLEVSSS